MNSIKDLIIVSLDVESTGLDVVADAIIQIGLVKRMPDGTQHAWSSYVNPGFPIPKASTEIHGITDEMVKDAPTFDRIAQPILDFIADAQVLTG